MSSGEFDNLSFFSLESEVEYYARRIKGQREFLAYLEERHENAVKRLAQLAVSKAMERRDGGTTEQEWLGNEPDWIDSEGFDPL